MRIAIVGGGIGSMTLALSLLDAGIDDVDIYESASAVKELGVGINVLPHAVRELTDLGLLEALYRPMSKRYKDQGRALINWVAECKTADDQPMPQQDWEHTTRLEEVLTPFAAFRFDCLDVPAMIRGAEVIYPYPMVDRDPLPTWDFGRITLLGDAAHPMHPAGSNGASQAILDARVLARELALQPSIEAAVAGYDALRRPATALVVQANHQGGPEQCMEIVEQRAPEGFSTLDDIVSQQELEEIARAYKRTAGFDPETLNSRPSLSVR